MGPPLILQLDAAGNPQQWIDFEKAAYYYCKDLVGWVAGHNNITLTGGVSRVTGQQSKLVVNSIISVSGTSGCKRPYPPTLTNQTLFRRDGNICAYCGSSFSSKVLTRDHVHPRTRGGKDVWTNVVTACKPCNNHKGDRLLTDKMLIEYDFHLRFKPYTPTKAEAMVLNNKAILDDQYDYLASLLSNDSRVLELHPRPINVAERDNI